MKEISISVDEFDESRIDDFILPDIEKFVDKRGYIYVVYDAAFPEHIKVGRTFEPKKRLASYNSDKPYKTARFLYISKPFIDCYLVEEQILAKLYATTEPTTFTKEWFEIKHTELIKSWILKAEKHFETISI